jgi:hypothetical protein
VTNQNLHGAVLKAVVDAWRTSADRLLVSLTSGSVLAKARSRCLGLSLSIRLLTGWAVTSVLVWLSFGLRSLGLRSDEREWLKRGLPSSK